MIRLWGNSFVFGRVKKNISWKLRETLPQSEKIFNKNHLLQNIFGGALWGKIKMVKLNSLMHLIIFKNNFIQCNVKNVRWVTILKTWKIALSCVLIFYHTVPLLNSYHCWLYNCLTGDFLFSVPFKDFS